MEKGSKLGRPRKGPKTGGGSRKGCPNKIKTAVKEMVVAALHGVGGQEYLETQARQNPKAFMTLLAKCIPTQLAGHDGGAIEVKLVDMTDAQLLAVAAGEE